MKSLRPLLIVILFAMTFALTVASWKTYRLVHDPMPVYGTEPVVLVLDKSTTAKKFAALLEEKGLIASAKVFLTLVRWEGLANQLKAGVYEIKPGESALDLLNRVSIGDVKVFHFPIIAGTSQRKISEDLQHAPYLQYDNQAWNAIKGSYVSAEGLVLADTYHYLGGSTSKGLLLQAHHNLMAYLNQVWEQRSLGLPYRNPYELLTAASIIEKETAIASERKLISGVIVNRLKKGMPLQMDPTIIYGLGTNYKGKLTHQNMKLNSPYNSYLNRGLPPTPIAMVGQEAINAAAHPDSSKYLYFVARGDGTHQFSETYEEQRRAIRKFQHKDG